MNLKTLYTYQEPTTCQSHCFARRREEVFSLVRQAISKSPAHTVSRYQYIELLHRVFLDVMSGYGPSEGYISATGWWVYVFRDRSRFITDPRTGNVIVVDALSQSITTEEWTFRDGSRPVTQKCDPEVCLCLSQ